MPDSLTEDFLAHWKVSSVSLDGISTAGLVAGDSPTICGALEGVSSALGFSAGFSVREFAGALLVATVLDEGFMMDELGLAMAIVETF
jgi:hypothetical protein